MAQIHAFFWHPALYRHIRATRLKSRLKAIPGHSGSDHPARISRPKFMHSLSAYIAPAPIVTARRWPVRVTFGSEPSEIQSGTQQDHALYS